MVLIIAGVYPCQKIVAMAFDTLQQILEMSFIHKEYINSLQFV